MGFDNGGECEYVLYQRSRIVRVLVYVCMVNGASLFLEWKWECWRSVYLQKKKGIYKIGGTRLLDDESRMDPRRRWKEGERRRK